jgi:hypothetical protein
MQLRQSIEGVMDILSEANVAQDLSDIIEAYLLAQDRRTMKDCVPSHSPYKNVASAVDNLGWNCFVEGRIPQVLIGVVKPMLRRYIPRGSVELWGAKFIKSLLSITHKQWLYRISVVHHVIDGLSSRQQQELMVRIHELLQTKKNSLLKRHKHLMDVDFVELGSGPTIVRQVWVANVEMAISVAKVARGNFCTQDNLRLLHMPTPKSSANLRKKQVPNYTSFKHSGNTTVKQPGTMTPCHSARSARLSKSPYYDSRTHRSPPPLTKPQALLLMRIRQPRDAMNKTLRQVFPASTPTTDLRPDNKISEHLTGFTPEEKSNKSTGIILS